MVTRALKPKKPIWRVALRITALVIVLALFFFSVIYAVSPDSVKFGNSGIITMRSSNMKGEIPQSSLVLYDSNADVNNLEKGQVIVFKHLENQETVLTVRYFDSYSLNFKGDTVISVYDDSLAVESYKVSLNDFVGVVTKDIGNLGAVIDIFSSNYGILFLLVLAFILGFAPILFAKSDNDKIMDKRYKKIIAKKHALEKKAEKKKAPIEEKLNIVCYKSESLAEKEHEEFLRNKANRDEIPPCPGTCAICANKRHNGVKITISVILAVFIIIIIAAMFMQMGGVRLETLDFKTDAIDDAQTNALVRYSEFSLASTKKGDLIVVRVADTNGNEGVAIRRYSSSQLNETGDVEIFTYGANENVLDANILSLEDVIGKYGKHYNNLGNLYEFFVSDVFYFVVLLSVLLILALILFYKYNNRVIYDKRLSSKSKKLADNNRLATVKAVSVGNDGISFKGVAITFASLIALAVISTCLILGFGVKFLPIESTRGATDDGAYALYYNNGVDYKIGDVVVINEKMVIEDVAYDVRGTRYIVDIVDGKYYLGVKQGTPDADGIAYSIEDFAGKQVFAVNNLVWVFNRLGEKDMIIIYCVIAVLLVILLSAAGVSSHIHKLRQGLNKVTFANTIALDDVSGQSEKINKMPIWEHLEYCDDNVRASYNYIRNNLEAYKKTEVKPHGIYERVYIGKKHYASISIIDNVLYMLVDIDTERFDNAMVITHIKEDKFKEPTNKVRIGNINEAVSFIKTVKFDLANQKLVSKKKAVYNNYANSYSEKSVISTDKIKSYNVIR